MVGWLGGDFEESKEDSIGSEKQMVIEDKDAFKTHIAVMNLLYASNVIRTSKANEFVLKYTDVDRCEDTGAPRITAPCDSSLSPKDRCRAHQGQMIIVSGNHGYAQKQKRFTSRNQKRRTNVVTSCFDIGDLACWRSARSKKVRTCAYAAELRSLGGVWIWAWSAGGFLKTS